MQQDWFPLFEAIRARCQAIQWFGPDALKPTQELPQQSDDPFVDEVLDGEKVSEQPSRFGFAFPPATEEQIHTTETRLGFALPPLLRCLYLQVANGGFGPGTGLCGAEGGYKGAYPLHDGLLSLPVYQSVLSYSTYRERRAQATAGGTQISYAVPNGEWLEHLVTLCDLGCCEEIGIDTQERMFLLSPTETNAFYNLEQLPWSFEEWLWRWLRGEALIEAFSSRTV